MTPTVLKPQPMNAAAFAPFGDVIDSDGATEVFTINDGLCQRFHDLARLDLDAEGGRPLLSLFRATPLPLPIRIARVERHPLSSQAFFPLSGRPWLVLVAPPGPFAPERLSAFLAGPNQGVNYRPGTWHHFCLALGEVSDFLVVDRGGPGANCDEVELDPRRPILLEA